jgi:hypothetical protein
MSEIKSRSEREKTLKTYLDVNPDNNTFDAIVTDFEKRHSDKSMKIVFSVDGGEQGTKTVWYYPGFSNGFRINAVVEALCPELAENGGDWPSAIAMKGRKCRLVLGVEESEGYSPKNSVIAIQKHKDGPGRPMVKDAPVSEFA